jgi:integrase/recombinase XerD
MRIGARQSRRRNKEVPMLKDLFPQGYSRYASLPLLGGLMDEFTSWLAEQGYTRRTRRLQLRDTFRIDGYLCRRGVRDVSEITHNHLNACWTWYRRRSPGMASTAHVLQRFLGVHELVPPPVFKSPSRTSVQVTAYSEYLRDVRGFGHSAVRNHIFTVRQFLDHLQYESEPSILEVLAPSEIESFVQRTGKKRSRASLQHTVAHLRSFLRFLAATRLVRPGLYREIDTPRLYRLEKLPRVAMPWATVRAFLDSIDRTTRLGFRDYTMFFFMATYGLRCCEIVALTLDAIDWRAESLQVRSRKNGGPLVLPLTEDAGALLLNYLQHGRPASPRREVFLRMRAPAGAMKPTAVGEAFRGQIRKSGLEIPLQGPHCLRHSYAVHLLRLGTSLKSIGDLLGHRLAESTCMYLRLAIDDLREVALPVPLEDPRADKVEA